MPDGDDFAIAAVTAAELLAAVERRSERAPAVRALLERLTIVAYDLRVAREHARLLARAEPRGAHDLQIAATARATGRTVLTTDRRAFDDLPGVEVRVLG